MKINKFVVIALFAVLITSCSQAVPSTSQSEKINTASQNSEKSGGGGILSGTQKGQLAGKSEDQTVKKISLEETEQSQTAPTTVERKIIRNADLTLEANSPEEAQQKISAIAESRKGFVIESTQSSSDVKTTTRDTVTMTVRVPAEQFNAALDEIRKTSSRVIVETVKGEDVTEEFIDIEARLMTKKALEAQFLEIMKRANSVEDALNVQRELANVRGEIEQIEGRKRFLENQSSLSTIKITLQSPTAFSANSSGFFYQLKESIGSGFDAALSFVLGFITFLIALLPFLLLVVLPICLIVRYLWNKRRKKNLASEIARDEIKIE